MREEPFNRCDYCSKPANSDGDRAWYIAQYKTSDSDHSGLHIRGVLCEECSHELGHGLEKGDTDGCC